MAKPKFKPPSTKDDVDSFMDEVAQESSQSFVRISDYLNAKKSVYQSKSHAYTGPHGYRWMVIRAYKRCQNSN